MRESQVKHNIDEADASICLLNVQSQLGLADRGPLPARTLAEAALQVTSLAAACPYCRSPDWSIRAFLHGALATTAQSYGIRNCGCRLAGMHPLMQGIAQASRASQVDSIAAEAQPSSLAAAPSKSAAVLSVFRILAVAGRHLNGSAR